MAKRFVCYLLALCLLGPMGSEGALATEAEGPIDVTLSLYSNISHDTYISGLYDDNVFYITLEKLCELVDGTVTSRSNNQATIKVGIREFELDVGNGNMAEKLYSENYNITMPSILKDGKIYISALHFLRYIGATVHIDEQASIQFMVIKRYDIFNAIKDLSTSESGNFFWWDEIDTEYGEIEDLIVNAGVVALINRDSNIFRMMFDAKGMEREAVEDALLSIVKNEGAGYFDENSKESELIDTASGLVGAESDWFGLIKEAFQDTSELGDQISDLADSAALTAGFANNVVKAVESLKQFDNMSVIQKDLLANTILAHSNNSKTLNNQWGVVLDAARNVDAKVQNEYAAQIGAATQVAQSTAYDLMNGVTGAAGANPISIAWNGAILLTKLIPSTNQMIGRKDKLYNAYNSSMIQLIANEMLVDAYSGWYYSNGMYTNVGNQYDMLNTVKQLMILQLKSTLTTREYLIQSGFLEKSYAEWMKTVNQEIALLLNKTENCKITGVNMHAASYDDDISWISKYNEPNYSNLVVDAYAETYTDEFGTYVWRVPKIMLSGGNVSSINDELWENLFVGAISENHEGIQQGNTFVIYDVIDYDWTVIGNILSLLITTNIADMSWTDYYVYNISVPDGTVLSKQDVLSHCGLTDSLYKETARQALYAFHFSCYEESIYEHNDVAGIEYADEALAKTISAENIVEALPFINNKGELCIVCPTYSIAGADYYYNIINLDTFTIPTHYPNGFQCSESPSEVVAHYDSYTECYKATLSQYPEYEEKSWGKEYTEYTLYDVNKDGIPELIIKKPDIWNYVFYTYNGTESVLCGELWDSCFGTYAELYEYEGNGIVVHGGGMGSDQIEHMYIQQLVDNSLTEGELSASTEEISFDELYSMLEGYKPIDKFYRSTDFSVLGG